MTEGKKKIYAMGEWCSTERVLASLHASYCNMLRYVTLAWLSAFMQLCVQK